SPARTAPPAPSAARSPRSTGWCDRQRNDAGRARWATEPAGQGSRSCGDARIEHAVEQVGEAVEQHEDHGIEQHRGLYEGKVAGEDRLYHQAADTGPGEDRFDDH